MRRALVPLALCLGLAAAPAWADVLVTVDKAAQRMTVAVDGQDRFSWPVSTGVPGHDTPSGTFQPNRMDPHHFSREWDDAPMPDAIFFTQEGHAIHGTGHVSALGRAASHGCVRLSVAHAATLFALVKAEGMGNTRVVIEGDDGAGADVEAIAAGGESPLYAPAAAHRRRAVRAVDGDALWADDPAYAPAGADYEDELR